MGENGQVSETSQKRHAKQEQTASERCVNRAEVLIYDQLENPRSGFEKSIPAAAKVASAARQ